MGAISLATDYARTSTPPSLAEVDSTDLRQPPIPRAGDEKDPLIAGVLSFVIPGVGSFYAGNNRHGWTHLGIHAAAIAVMIGGATSTASSGSSSGLGMVGVGYAAALVNGVWSIFTAVSDAKATR